MILRAKNAENFFINCAFNIGRLNKAYQKDYGFKTFTIILLLDEKFQTKFH